MNSAPEIAKILLDIKAVHLNVQNPFTWTSGIVSPIYCDNRQIISYPEHRKKIAQTFADLITKQFPDAEIIAGTATAGIPHAAWVADLLDLPMVYVRSASKGHGLKNLIEGKAQNGQKVVLIEDLISTGKSSIAAVEALTNANLNVLKTYSIFTYDLNKARKQFEELKTTYQSLTNVETLLKVALDQKIISLDDSMFIKQFFRELENHE